MTERGTPITDEREAIVRWRDPHEGLAQLRTMDGIEFLQKMASGDLPGAPMASHLNMSLVEVEQGIVTFRAQPDESHYNPIGMVHGGFVATLLDSALGCAAHTTLKAGTGYTSIEIKTSYLRSVSTDSGPLTCTGRVSKPGRRVIFAEGEVVDKDGKAVATASGSLLVFGIDANGPS